MALSGGDPNKAVIWGESVGVISVFDQMTPYDGDNTYKSRPLFRVSFPPIHLTTPKDRPIVQAAGCAGSPDTLDCIRGVSYGTFLRAATFLPTILSYEALALAYVPKPDGVVFRDSPDILEKEGRYAAVPMIIGNQKDDPGALTTSQLVDYFELYFHNASRVQLTTLVDTYDRRISAGSSFGTDIFSKIYPGFKSRAAILGELVLTKARYPAVPAWSYLNSCNYGTPMIGIFKPLISCKSSLACFPRLHAKVRGPTSTRVTVLTFNVSIGGYA
ncbi:lipase [Colletotrichum tofieldiae]|nr:lipase [Colletotrichum tofieldiae]